MYPRVLVNKNTAIIQLLRAILATTLSSIDKNHKSGMIIPENIHLYKSRDLSRILYISGVALRQKKNQNLHSMKLAQNIECFLSAKYPQELKVEITSPGLIGVEVRPRLLSTWLQHIVSGETEYKLKNKSENSHFYLSMSEKCANPSSVFALQYTHARCCSLIQLAAREKLIQLGANDAFGSSSWIVVNPSPIPWLEENQELRLVHPAEFRFISELIKAMDDLECSFLDEKSIDWEKTAAGLSQSFEAFWSNCRIWGEVKNTHQELAQARIGLILFARLVFERLLEERLGLIALQEL